jgi:light-regulated signal transduction histidine kinase (bacteriophytochrome)
MILRSLVSPGRREIRVGRDMINPALHIAMHEIVANQLWADNPPEVWAIAQRLLADGYDRPFQRSGRQRVGHTDGNGLGLAIVQAIAAAHHAKITAQPRPEGGLDISVTFGVSDG